MAKPTVEMVYIAGNLADGLAFTRPVRVEVWIEDGEYVAAVAELNLHAFGATREEAIVNIRFAIVDQHKRFAELRGRLSPLMREEAAKLEGMLQQNDT